MEQFRSTLIGQYYRNVDGVILVYDVTRRESFEHLEDWLGEIRRNCRDLETLRLALIGNKSDCDVADRQVITDEGQEYAEKQSMLFMETSAKDLKSLEQLQNMLNLLGERMLAAREESSFTRSMSSVIHLQQTPIDDDWEIITTPHGPVPRSSHCHQDDQRRVVNALNKCQC